jgi:hypothetical protein
MSNDGSGLPQDIREQMENQKPPGVPQSPGGIGGRAKGNAATAYQRNVAMGQKDDTDEPVTAEADVPEAEETNPICPNSICNAKTAGGDNFCARCGTDLITGGAERKLGIKLTEEDLQDYIFKGYVVRDLKVLGKHKITVRSSQASDLGKIDDFIVNGEWSKDKEGNERQVSDFMLRQMNAMCLAAMAIQKFDGTSLGESLGERVAWLEEKGSALVDMFATRVTLYNRAITEYLKKEDSLLGS